MTNVVSQTAIGQLPQDWSVAPLSELCSTIIDGTHYTPRYVDSGIPFYSVENVTADDFQDTKFISIAEHELLSRRCRPERGDILLTRIGSLGDTKLIDWEVDASIYVSLALLKLRDHVSSHYIYRYTKSQFFVRDVEKRSLLNAAPKKINMGEIGNVPIPIPPTIEEQNAIAGALRDIDELVGSLDALIAKKRDIKQAAMQQLLTGKIRLPGFNKAWATTTVGEVTSRYFCGPSPTCLERNIEGDEEWGVLKTTAITWETGWDWTKHKTLPRVHWGRHSIELKTGDVLVTKAGPRHRVGVCTWVDEVPHRIVPSGKMIVLRPKVGVALAPLLSAAIAHRDAQRFLDQRTTGMAESQVNFENQDLLDTPILLPEYQEQKAIASILSDMDQELSMVISKRRKLDPMKEGMSQQLLTGRIRFV